MEVKEKAYYEYPKPLTPNLKVTNIKQKSFKYDNNMHKFIFFTVMTFLVRECYGSPKKQEF
jgi:hypothetical protein